MNFITKLGMQASKQSWAQENANFLERKKHFKIENLASLEYI